MKNFRDLAVWVKAHQLTQDVYANTSGFPADERFGLTNQVRRASVSIGANIAEGCGRRGDGEFHRFLQIAMGSASEVEYHLLLARDLKFLKPDKYVELNESVTEVKKMLSALIRKVDQDRNQS